MFNPDRHMSDEDAVQVVLNGKYGVLSTASKDAEPYGVAVNYVYVPGDNALYFHCQLKGRKISNMKENDRVSLFVIGREEIVPERFITHYESAIVTGRASFISDKAEKREKILLICNKFAPDSLERRDAVIDKYIATFYICKIDIESITGKRNNDY